MPALKRFLCSILTLCSMPLLAADSTIGNLTPITVVPDAYRMPWENPGVVDYYITFQNLTNQILSGYQTTNTILGQISVGNGGALTNVPFSIWTNYGAAPLTYTNLNGLAFSPGFGMTSSWTFTNIPGIGPIGIRVNSADTNHFITTDYGGTFTGAVYSVATSQLAPASNQLVTAAFVRNLAAGSGVPYYAGNTVDPVATNATPIGQPVYQFQSTIPASFNRTYTTADYLTNNGYVGSIVTTNSFQSLQGQILVVAYLSYSGGSASPTLTVHPEIYISYDRTNWTTEFSAGTQNIFYGTTNAYQFLIDIPLTVATNSTGFWIERRFKVDSVTGAGTRTLTFLGGTNAVSGVNDASHITAQSPTATSGNAYLAANQTFTGTNTFTKPIYLSNSGTNTITLDPVTGTVTASNVVGSLSGNATTATYVSGTITNIVQNSGTNSVGKLGIGTNAPAASLVVVGDNSSAIQIIPGTSTTIGKIYNNNGTLSLISTSGGAIQLANDSTIGNANSTSITLASGAVILSRGPLKFTNVTASNPPTSGSGTAFLFSATNSAGTAEIFTMDGAGVIKQISEHAMDAPPQLIDDDDEAPNISKEILSYTGKVRWINRSRAARQQEMTTKLALNSLAYYQFTTGKSPTQWTNSNSYGFWTNAIAYLDPLTAAQKQLVIVESFAEYNTRMGLTNGNGLVKANWTNDQARFQSEYAASFTNLLNGYNAALASYQTNVLTDTNAIAPVAPVWNPPPVQPLPSWLQKRGAQ